LKTIILFLALFFASIYTTVYGQEHDSEVNSEHAKIVHHWLDLFVGYTLINEAIGEEGKELIVVPTIGLDYEYMFNHRISLTWVNDLELGSYIVEKSHSENLIRSYAYVTAVVFAYEFYPFWGVYAGPGYEFEEHEGFAVAKIGTEFIKEFEGGWKIALGLTVDIKDVNTSTSIGLVVKRALSKAK
jgi:hypothetical protein